MIELFEEISVASSLDNSSEPSLLYLPPKAAVMVVGLHTWSNDRVNQVKTMLPFCKERGWALLLPEFRGSNLQSNPRVTEAGGSALARRDIIDATNWTIGKRFASTPSATFLLGGSGGGHMALMVAGRENFTWTGVSSWCPITDLALWHAENPAYAPHIEAVCGGQPGASPQVDAEYRERSPIYYLPQLAHTNLSLHHGRGDASVPYTHTLRLAMELEKLTASRLFFEIFDGAHEIQTETAFRWFDKLLDASHLETRLTG